MGGGPPIYDAGEDSTDERRKGAFASQQIYRWS
jgi:hypothetical protein